MGRAQLTEYVPVLVLAALGVVFTAGMLLGSWLLGVRGRRNPAKDRPWESGMIPEGPPPARVPVRFYRVAMLFVLFDLAVVFLYPWAVVYRALLAETTTRHSIWLGMLGFIAVLGVGYVYALKKGALTWKD